MMETEEKRSEIHKTRKREKRMTTIESNLKQIHKYCSIQTVIKKKKGNKLDSKSNQRKERENKEFRTLNWIDWLRTK